MKNYAIVAHTQVLENYGSAEQPHWKLKFGTSYWLADVEFAQDKTPEEAVEYCGNLPNRGEIEIRNSAHTIEFIKSFEAISQEEACQRHFEINIEDEDISTEDYLRYLKRPRGVWSGYFVNA